MKIPETMRLCVLRDLIAGTALCLVAAAGVWSDAHAAAAVDRLELAGEELRVAWRKTSEGWRVGELAVRGSGAGAWSPVGTPSGDATVLYSEKQPDTNPVKLDWAYNPQEGFPGTIYKYLTGKWRESTTQVAFNTAGEATRFYPETAEMQPDGSVRFVRRTPHAKVVTEWTLDRARKGELAVRLTLEALHDGYFSLATPSLATATPEQLTWAMVPGVLQGTGMQKDFFLAYAYAQGLPEKPVVVRERSTSTLAPMMELKGGVTLATMAEPGVATDPWTKDKDVRAREWRLGLSHMNRQGQLTPTLYHPVLGQVGSKMKAGESRTWSVRYIVRAVDWFTVLNQVAYEHYRLGDFLAMKEPPRALSDRLRAMHTYVTDDKTSLWRTEEFGGLTIGAQAYMGGVVGSDKDAMKNSDYGAMAMLSKLTGDPRLTKDRMPFARNFKLVQQQAEPGFFQGAAVGQYYLSKSRRFTEEWGDYVEPVALTYYTMLDLGNLLLFAPQDADLRARLRLGADRLLEWQRKDGSWEVAYDRATEKRAFADLRDVRPTFYGLMVAHRLLGDAKYLEGAKRGADWIVREAVEPGHYLGVCGDARFAPDFATGQIAQALLDLADITGVPRYREAGLRAARFYATSVYTHPLATREVKNVKGTARKDWEINQSGLSFEHGGILGSATGGGPILLASHSGLFIRVYAMTGDVLLRDLARAGAVARDAFVEPNTSVASYYWNAMNRGAGPYPHHAWWQIGWITDYLQAEAELRSRGSWKFARGFMTPKVGPHGCYGFEPGTVLGEKAELGWGVVTCSDPSVDWLVAHGAGGSRTYVALMSERAQASEFTVKAEPAALQVKTTGAWKKAELWTPDGGRKACAVDGTGKVSLPAYGLGILVLE